MKQESEFGQLSVSRVVLDENGNEIEVQDLVGSAARDAEMEKLKEFHEHEEDLVKEFEYVPLQLMYQNLQAERQAHGSHQFIGTWPFKKEIVSPARKN